MNKSSDIEVKKRRVFYIPGYDPIHPRRYRELYRKEGAAQAAISGYEIDLKPGEPGDNFGWQVQGHIAGAEVQAQVEVLVWSDIVRDSMSTSIPGTYLQMLRTAWIYILTGALWRLMKLRKGPVIAALYPVGMLLAQLALACALALGVMLIFPTLMGFLFNAKELFAERGVGFGGLVAGALALVAVLRWFKKRDNKFFAYYLMHDYSYSASSRGANPPELEARLAAFGETVAAALETDVEEVLVVGHSSGAHLGVSVLADLIRAGRVPTDGPAMSFLTLGQVVPMVSFLPKAGRLRDDLQYLSARDELSWVDVTAPGDGCAFALCDPVSVSSVAPKDKKWPLVFSAAFTQTLSPERLERVALEVFSPAFPIHVRF